MSAGKSAGVALDIVNPEFPHYKQSLRGFVVRDVGSRSRLKAESLTVNGKLKRDVIAARMKNEIEEMYGVRQAV